MPILISELPLTRCWILDKLRVSFENCPTKQRILMKSAIKYISSERTQAWDSIFCRFNGVSDSGVYTTITQSCHLNFTEKLLLLFHFLLDFIFFVNKCSRYGYLKKWVSVFLFFSSFSRYKRFKPEKMAPFSNIKGYAIFSCFKCLYLENE